MAALLISYIIISAFGICYVASLFVGSDTTGFFLFVVGFIGTLTSSAISGLWVWRKASTLWVGPSVLGIFFLMSMKVFVPIRIWLNEGAFKANLAIYNTIVKHIKDGSIAESSDLGPVGGKEVQMLLAETHYFAAKPVQIAAARSKEGAVLLEVSLVADPLAHTGYLYKDYDSNDDSIPESMRLSKELHMRHLTGNWYSFSD